MAVRFSRKLGELFEIIPDKSIEKLRERGQIAEILEADMQAEVKSQGSLEIGQALEILATEDTDSPNTEVVIARAVSWLTENVEEISGRFKEAEEQLTHAIRTNKRATLPMLRLLSEMVQHTQEPYVDMDLANELDTNPGFPDEAEQFYGSLNQLNHPQGNLMLHKLVDYAEMHHLTLHNTSVNLPGIGASKFMDYYDDDGYWYSFYDRFGEFAEQEAPKAANYLVQKHLENVLAIRNINRIDNNKQDRLEGWVVGATDDATIYTTRHLDDAYTNRLKLGLTSSVSGEEPVFEIMPGYLGKYRNGKLDSVYRDEELYSPEFMEVQVKQRNNAEDEKTFYRVFNKAWYEQSDVLKRDIPNKESLVNGNLADAIYHYQKDVLRPAKRYLFIDKSQIDDYDELPLVIKRHIQSINDEAVEQYFKNEQLPQAEAISQEEWHKILSPVEPLSEEAAYNFRYISNIGTRKRIEDDLGLQLNKIPPFGQRAFLEYVSQNTVEDFTALKETLSSRPSPELKAKIATTFFACAEDKGNAEHILKLVEQVESPELLSELLDVYLKTVEAGHNLENYVHERIQDKTVTSEQIVRMYRNFMKRANSILINASQAGSAEGVRIIIDTLRNAKEDADLYASMIREMVESGDLTDPNEIVGSSFVVLTGPELAQNSKLAEALWDIYKENWESKTDPLYLVTLRKKFKQRLENPAARFYVWSNDDEPIVFGAFSDGYTSKFGPQYGTGKYFGAFNTKPRYQNAKLGKLFLKRTIQREDTGEPMFLETAPDNTMRFSYMQEGFEKYHTHATEGGEVEDYYVRLPQRSNVNTKAA